MAQGRPLNLYLAADDIIDQNKLLDLADKDSKQKNNVTEPQFIVKLQVSAQKIQNSSC